MRASFDYIVMYRVSGVTAAPLRTGGIENDPQQMLRRHDGRYFLQGSGLAGALRGWLEPQDAPLCRILFGSSEREGALSVSDCVFGVQAHMAQRPRLKIDGATGTALDGSKFDVAHLEAGASFEFTLIWKGLGKRSAELAAVERCLAALNGGEITLGAQRSNGFGRLSLQRVAVTEYDMTQAADRTAWLNGGKAAKVLSLPQGAARRTAFTVTMTTDRLLVKSSTGDASAKITQLTEAGEPVVPGSSLKGAFRAQAVRVAPLLGLNETAVDELFGCTGTKAQRGKAGKVYFSDGKFLKRGECPVISRICIDKFTGGVQRGKLFTARPVDGLCRFTVTLPAEETKGCALLLCLLRDLGGGRFTLGGDAATGSGRATGLTAEIAVPGNKAAELQCTGGVLRITSGDVLVNEWLAELGGAQ